MKAVLIHIPSLPWECIARDDAAQLVPTLFAMIEGGSAGPLPAVGAATGMYLDAPAVTGYLDAAGVRCASVNLAGTSFGVLANGVVASDDFFKIRTSTFDDWDIPPGALAPPEMAQHLADLRVHPEDLLPEQLAPLIAREPQADSAAQLRTMARALAESSGAHSVAAHLVETGACDVCIVRYPMFAQLEGQFAAPAAMPTGKGAAWLLIELVDKFVARLKVLAGEDTVLMVTGGLETKPFWIAQGPGIPGDRLWPQGTTLDDVAPSLLALFGLKDDSMPGSARIGRSDLLQASPPAA